ncbi:MAG: hypothetical protein M1826_003693 [Phylliscum demangeonii]|nr:MAG: hypothetical protein M1826_003693 [Phylliscum demangeonii]
MSATPSSSSSSFIELESPFDDPTEPAYPHSSDLPLDDSIDEFDSLPSSSSLDNSDDDDDDDDGSASDAEREWRESLQQLELLLTMVLVPYVGKYFGRRCAYWGWARWMEWRYPVEVVVTDPAVFKGVGLVEAAMSL